MTKSPYHVARGSTTRPSAGRATLTLDEPQRAYAPGDSINGWVVLPNRPSGEAAGIVVTLFGRGKVKVVKKRGTAGGPNGGGGSSTTTYRSRAALITVTERLLLEANSTETAAHDSLSFSIVIPAKTQALNPPDGGRGGLSIRPYWDHFDAGNFFPGSPGHPLPPTFKNQWRSMSTKAEAYVEYHLSAVAIVGNVRQTIASEIPIRIVPVAPPAETLAALETQYYSILGVHKIRSLRLLPENVDRQIGFRESAKHFFKSSSLPVFGYKIHGLIHRNLCAGSPVQIELQMQPMDNMDPKAITPPQTPSVTLKQVDIELHAHTVCRTAGMLFDKSEDNERLVWSTYRPVNAPFDPESEYKKSVNLGTLPMALAPTFATYNVRVHYTMKIKVKTMCASELQTTKGGLQAFLLGRKRELVQPDQGGASSLAGSVAPMYAEEDWGELTMDNESEDLPSYRDAMAAVELPANAPPAAELPAGAPAHSNAGVS